MAYDEALAARLRAALRDEQGVTEKRMFGGVAFLVDGHMAVSASGRGGILLRVEPAETDALIRTPHAEPFVMRGRPMHGWLRIDAAGLRTDEQLGGWIARGLACARALPAR